VRGVNGVHKARADNTHVRIISTSFQKTMRAMRYGDYYYYY
jgi:hypothetical protein